MLETVSVPSQCRLGAGDCSAPNVCLPFAAPLPGAGAAFGACVLCSDGCGTPDGTCSDGGPGSTAASCALGADCTDCGPRQ